jgi:2-methylcitrate dehydratase PrpD
MLEPSLSGQLSAVLSRLTYQDLSTSQARQLKACFLDRLGSKIAGKGLAPVKIIVGVIHDIGGTSESTIIPTQSHGNCLMAALAIGASSHLSPFLDRN